MQNESRKEEVEKSEFDLIEAKALTSPLRDTSKNLSRKFDKLEDIVQNE